MSDLPLPSIPQKASGHSSSGKGLIWMKKINATRPIKIIARA
jgi:hypothetical protein